MELSKLLLALMSSSSSSSSCLFLIWLLIINGNSSLVESSHQVYPQLQSPAANDVDPLYRTGFHFQPPRNWINDPNGPMYYNGVYHVFYQYNPEAAVWGNIVWAHSVSRDMINWDAVKHALYPSKPFDINGCWSGSATILPGNKPVILYTGVDRLERQVQNIAFPANLSDPYLQDWVKPDYNPLIAPTLDMNVSSFRDPTTAWWNHGQWRILVGGRIGGNTGTAWLYRSTDFKKWTKAKNPLHSVPNTGMWECPDFYPVAIKGQSGLDASVVGPNVKHVLKVSLDENRCDYYTVGRYDMRDDTHIPQTTSVDGRRGLRYDYGNFYGSKSFFDSESKRRIIWGWANESSDPTDDVKKGWAGIMAIPRTVWLDANGRQLLQWPVKEVEQLRMNPVHELSQRPLNMGDRVEINGITAVQADVEVTFSFANASLDKAELFDPRWENLDAQEICALKGSKVQGGLGPFGLMTLATKDIEEYTPVFFSIFKTRDGRNVVTMCSDASSSSLGSKLYKPSFAGFVDVDLRPGTLSLRTLIDRSVVETFGAGGKTVILSRVYPTKAVGNNAHLFAFNNGAQPITIKHLSAWSMKTPRRMDNMHF